jgi:thiol-disulfide isomerase/thioredoxin
LTISLISRGSVEQNRAKSTEHGVTGVLVQEDWEVAQSYEAHGTPSAVLVRPDGKIGSPVTSGAEALQRLVAYALGERTQLPLSQPRTAQEEPCPNCGKAHPTNGHAQQGIPAGPKVGERAPEIKLKDFKGEEVLVLFWNPGCGFCQKMLPDLKEWEKTSSEGAPKLLVVSAGAVDANKKMGLSSPVLLDQQFSVGRSFGASGTPSGVLVDKEGDVASEVAVGAQAVLALAEASPTTQA